MAQCTLPWQPNLGSKLAKSANSFSFVALAFQIGLEYRHSDFKKSICDDLATLFANLVNFGTVSPECNIAKVVQPLISFFKTNISDKLSQDSLDRFSQNFHHMVGI